MTNLVGPELFSKTGWWGQGTNDWDAHVEGSNMHISKPLPALRNSPRNSQFKSSAKISNRKHHQYFTVPPPFLHRNPQEWDQNPQE